MRASGQMDSRNIRAALQILQTNTRAPQNSQTAAEVNSLVAVEADAHETTRIKAQCAAIKQAALTFSPPRAKLVKRMAKERCAELGPSCWRNANIAANGRSEGGPAVLRDWIGAWTQAAVPPKTARLWISGDDTSTGLWAEETRVEGSVCRNLARKKLPPLRWRRC